MGQTYNYYYKTKALDEEMQKLFMVWLIRNYEDCEINDNFVDGLYNIYVGCEFVDNIVEYVDKLNNYLCETEQDLNQMCLEQFKDYITDND